MFGLESSRASVRILGDGGLEAPKDQADSSEGAAAALSESAFSEAEEVSASSASPTLPLEVYAAPAVPRIAQMRVAVPPMVSNINVSAPLDAPAVALQPQVRFFSAEGRFKVSPLLAPVGLEGAAASNARPVLRGHMGQLVVIASITVATLLLARWVHRRSVSRKERLLVQSEDAIIEPWRRSLNNELRPRLTLAAQLGMDDFDEEELPKRAIEYDEQPAWPGLKDWSPDVYIWLFDGAGTGRTFAEVILFFILQCASRSMEEFIFTAEVNVASIYTTVCAASLVMSTLIVVFLEGGRVLRQITSPHLLWRFLGIGTLFIISNMCKGFAFQSRMISLVRSMLSYLKMPLAACLSMLLFDRQYGQLETFSLIIMSLAAMAFGLLHERCNTGSCSQLVLTREAFAGIGPKKVVLLIGVATSVVGSVLAERLYKRRSSGFASLWEQDANRYHVMKVYLDASGVLVSGAIWIGLGFAPRLSLTGTHDAVVLNANPVGVWDGWTCCYVAVGVAEWWMAGYITMRFSTVTKCLILAISTVISITAYDMRFYYDQISIPYSCMAAIVVFAALIYQTGRANIRKYECVLKVTRARSVEPTPVAPSIPPPAADTQALEGPASSASSSMGDVVSSDSEDHEVEEVVALESPETSASSMGDSMVKASLFCAFVVVDALRTMSQTIALGDVMLVPQTMAIMINVVSLFFSMFFVFTKPRENSDGWTDLKDTWRWKNLKPSLVSGFLFALTSALLNMGIGLGISGSLNAIIGRSYMIVLALGSRWILGKFYMALEWFAIMILTLAAISFGFFENFGASGQSTSLLAIAFVVAAATCAAFSGLVTEMLLKSSPDPYNMQKVRLDAGSIFFGLLFLPLMGYISVQVGSPKGAFWEYRPLTKSCASYGYCDGASFKYIDPSNPSGFTPEVPCSCDYGLFVCWNSYKVCAMIIIDALRGQMIGLMIKWLSSVHRAIAEEFSLVLLFFVLDPIIKGTNFDNVAMVLSALILPFSSFVFAEAGKAMKRFADATEKAEKDEKAEKAEKVERAVTAPSITYNYTLTRASVAEASLILATTTPSPGQAASDDGDVGRGADSAPPSAPSQAAFAAPSVAASGV